MDKFKIIYIKWFFQVIWYTIVDFFIDPVGFFRYGIAKENWGDFKTRIAIDNDPEIKELERELLKITDDGFKRE